MKTTLNNLMKETLVNDISDKSTTSLMLAVLLKYGMAPLVCFYLAWVNNSQSEKNDKNTDRLVVLVESQTAATVKNTEVLMQLSKAVETNTRNNK